ncbi:MAG: fumarate hydratase [Wujia sp.]
MRTIHTDMIIEEVKNLCIDANLKLADDMNQKIRQAAQEEDGALGKQILNQLIENMDIAKEDAIPICQDTGMAVFFVNVGQDLHIEGMGLTDAINEGVRRGYTDGYLRKSVVADPLLRTNTGDNTPAIIHYDIVPGDKLEITIAPKGFGSENMSRVYMLKPADGEDGVKESVLEAVKLAGPNACPPMVVGVGLGGDFELAAKMAKKALTRPAGSHNPASHIARIEDELLELINQTGIGPGGLGGKTTALAVNIESYATHIAGMPLAVNMCCHVNRHKTVVL